MNDWITIVCFWLIFVGLFILVFPRLIYSMSNWALIEKKYGAITPNLVSGKVKTFQNLLINKMLYRGCFRIAENDKGIFFCPMFPFSIVHKVVFIPFNDMTFINEKKWNMELLSLNGTSQCILGVTPRLGQRIRKAQGLPVGCQNESGSRKK